MLRLAEMSFNNVIRDHQKEVLPGQHQKKLPGLGAVEVPKKRRLKRRLLQAPQAPFKAPIHSKCCIGGFRVTGLALVVVLRCD